jgi:hypothetical protein
VSKQKLDLLQIASALPAELGAGPPQVVGTEAFDADLLGRLLDDRPDRPVAQACPHVAPFADPAQQRPRFDPGRTLPNVDSLLHPDGDGNRPDASSLPFEIRQDPSAFPQLDGTDVERGKFLPAQRTADQQRQDHVVPLAFEGRAVGDGQQFLRLFFGEPVPQPGSLLPKVRDPGEAGGVLGREHPVLAGFGDHLADGRQPDINSRSGKTLDRGPVLHQELPGQRPAGREGEQVVERLGVIPTRVRRRQGVHDHPAQPLLGFGQAGAGRGATGVRGRAGEELQGHKSSLPLTRHIVVGNKQQLSFSLLAGVPVIPVS